MRFCLEDGTGLTDAVDEQATVVRRAGHDPHKTEELPAEVTRVAGNALRVEIPADKTTSASLPPVTQTTSGRGGSSPILKILLAVVIIGILAVLGLGLLGVAFYFGTGKRDTVDVKTPTPTPGATVTPWADTPTPDDELAKLEKELADLKKRLEDAGNADDDEVDVIAGKPARVNSPGDGFLALRSLPNADIGERIAKIPHGAQIRVSYCSDKAFTVSGRSGKWCMVTYGSQTGWAFDAWLDF